MLVGDSQIFALELEITQVFEAKSALALGFFSIHLDGFAYGAREWNATLLACSINEIARRLSAQGQHRAPFAAAESLSIAQAFRDAIYAENPPKEFFGLDKDAFKNLIHGNKVLWAPDGDEAFDDGSYVIHFDIHDQVRLIGFRIDDNGSPDPATLKDVWTDAESFYGTLRSCLAVFHSEWARFPKSSSPPNLH